MGDEVLLSIDYGQEVYPATKIEPLGDRPHPEDVAAAVAVPAALWAAYEDARRRLAVAEGAIVALDPERPWGPVPLCPPSAYVCRCILPAHGWGIARCEWNEVRGSRPQPVGAGPGETSPATLFGYRQGSGARPSAVQLADARRLLAGEIWTDRPVPIAAYGLAEEIVAAGVRVCRGAVCTADPCVYRSAGECERS